MNDEAYLKDPTGGRRFWPVEIGDIDLDALESDRDQLFAEAVHLFNAGAPWWPDRQFEAEVIKPEQEPRYATDPWLEAITNYLAGKSRVTISQVARDALYIETARIGTGDARRIREVLVSLKWVLKRGAGSGVRWYHSPGCDACDGL
jgi:predicted P-loop ATPase